MAGHFKPKFEHKLSLIIPSCHGFLKDLPHVIAHQNLFELLEIIKNNLSN